MHEEISLVVVSVCAAAVSTEVCSGGAGRGRWSMFTFVTACGRAVAKEVCDDQIVGIEWRLTIVTRTSGNGKGSGANYEGDLAGRGSHDDATAGVRRRKWRPVHAAGELDQEVLAGEYRAGSQVNFVRTEICSGAGILNRVTRGSEVNGSVAAVENLDEVVSEWRPSVTTSGVQLADHQIGSVVVFNRAGPLAIQDGRVGDICNVDEERLVWFDQQSRR